MLFLHAAFFVSLSTLCTDRRGAHQTNFYAMGLRVATFSDTGNAKEERMVGVETMEKRRKVSYDIWAICFEGFFRKYDKGHGILIIWLFGFFSFILLLPNIIRFMEFVRDFNRIFSKTIFYPKDHVFKIHIHSG